MQEFRKENAHRSGSVSAKTSDAEVAPIQDALAQRRATRLNPLAILQLQRTAGNRAVTDLLRATKEQTVTDRPRTAPEHLADTLRSSSGIGPVVFVLADPAPETPAKIQKDAGAFVAGWTYPPRGFKAPKFQVNAWSTKVNAQSTKKDSEKPDLSKKESEKPDASRPSMDVEWRAKPSLTQAADEGNATSEYVKAGEHETTMPGAKGDPIRGILSISQPISDAAREGELQHVNDHRLAYKISVKEAEEVLKNHVIGRTFGPVSTENAVEQQVIDAFRKNVEHAQLTNLSNANPGNLSAFWAVWYQRLIGLSKARDDKHWHRMLIDEKHCRLVAGEMTCGLVASETFNVKGPESADVVNYEKWKL